MTNQIGRKFDSGKPEFSLLPPWALQSVAEVLTFGAKKYEVDNWKYVSNGAHRYKNAAMRHINDYMKGEKCDPETGINHLAHAICCLMFILDADESGKPLAGSNTATVKFDVPAVNYVFSRSPTQEMQEFDPAQVTTVNLSGTAYPVNSLAPQYQFTK